MEPSYGGRRSEWGWDELRKGGGSFGQMKVDGRLLVPTSYFQRAPNPVRGPTVLAFPKEDWKTLVWRVEVPAAFAGPRP